MKFQRFRNKWNFSYWFSFVFISLFLEMVDLFVSKTTSSEIKCFVILERTGLNKDFTQYYLLG